MDKQKQAWHDTKTRERVGADNSPRGKYRKGLTLPTYRGWCMYGVLRPDQRRSGQEALRQSVIWTEAEDADLRAQVEAGAWLDDMAAWHMRSEGGIGMRMHWLGLLPPDDTDD